MPIANSVLVLFVIDIIWTGYERNEERLAEKMRHSAIARNLFLNDYLTVKQLQDIIESRTAYKANNYLLQIVKRNPEDMLMALKKALVDVGQEELVPLLPA